MAASRSGIGRNPTRGLFYAAVIVILGTAIGAAHSVLGWSDGLTFAVGIVAGTITCTMALWEDLSEHRRSPERRSHRG